MVLCCVVGALGLLASDQAAFGLSGASMLFATTDNGSHSQTGTFMLLSPSDTFEAISLIDCDCCRRDVVWGTSSPDSAVS